MTRSNRRKRTAAALVAVALAGGAWVIIDYRSWLALGPGGVPYNLAGWAQVTWLRLWKQDPLDSSGSVKPAHPSQSDSTPNCCKAPPAMKP